MNLTTHTFDETINSSTKPVIVDFWASWCGPCKPYGEVITQLANEQPGIKVAKVDIDAEPDLMRRFEVMAAPTTLVFVDGELVNRIVGARGIDTLSEELAEYL